ncbi:hypothetical protein ABTY20_18920 [Streptomyces sp. NPDC126497]|uniref:hypothetical protein n=1 Tax=Streptomyces sp. NPDC126497 TaxID=3155313 RepID=UPI00331D5390
MNKREIRREANFRAGLILESVMGVARKTSFGLSVTPDHRAPHDTPSLKTIRAVITANPVEG